MGKQNKSYDWEKCITNNSSIRKSPLYKVPSNVVSIQPKRNTCIKRSLYPVICLLIIWYATNFYLKKSITTISNTPVIKENSPHLIPGGIILKKDRQGHFRGTVLVNNIPMPFMIDTGATRTAIPRDLAMQAGLKFGRTMNTNTAGGKVLSYETHINQLKIGNAVIKNLPASINHHLKEVLIGMNTLKYFRMTQSGDRLTLSSNGYDGEIVEEPVSVINTDSYNSKIKPKPYNSRVQKHQVTAIRQQTPIKRPVVIKKRVNCSVQNGHKTCITSYSDR